MRTTLCLLLVVALGCDVDAGDAGDVGSWANALSVDQWTDDAAIADQRSPYQVGLTSLGSRIHMLYRPPSVDPSVAPPLEWSRFDGSTWSVPVTLSALSADYGPALATFDGRLVTIYHAHGENRLRMSTSDGRTWTSPVTAGVSPGTSTLTYAPAATEHRGALYVAYCTHNPDGVDRVRIDRFDGVSWTRTASFDVEGNDDCKSVAVTSVPGGRFRIVWNAASRAGWRCRGDGCWTMYEASGSPGSSSMHPHELVTMESTKPSSMVTCDGVTHLVHGGLSTPNEIWWSFYEDGRWTTNLRVPDQASSGGAQLACLDDSRTIMVHNNNYTQLFWSEFGD